MLVQCKAHIGIDSDKKPFSIIDQNEEGTRLSKFLPGCFLILLLTQSLYVAVVPSKGEAPLSYPINGPRLDEIVFVYQGTPEASVAAIRKGDTDVLSDIARPSDVAEYLSRS